MTQMMKYNKALIHMELTNNHSILTINKLTADLI